MEGRRLDTTLRHLGGCLRGAPLPGIDWPRLVALADAHFLGPRLHRALAQGGQAQGQDREALDYLETLDALNGARNRRLSAQLGELVDALQSRGIVPTILKGGAHLARCLGRDTLPSRMMRDLDLLIRADQGEDAARVLRACGYDRFAEDPGPHSMGCYFRPSDVGAVDMHVSLPPLVARLVPPGEMARRTTAIRAGSRVLTVPDASLQFVINLGHEMAHDEALVSGFVDLRYLLELIDLARDGAGDLDWDWIRATSGGWKLSLGLEVQDRMARHLGFAGFPGIGRTAMGRLLHERRLFKMAHRRIGQAEWRVIRHVNRLRHSVARHHRPTPLQSRV
ncbi:nucleotidyltransferase family protein [Roseivivax isoporae]|nr:nucleotidyltransferase family protein [Roseivivax isoporae]